MKHFIERWLINYIRKVVTMFHLFLKLLIITCLFGLLFKRNGLSDHYQHNIDYKQNMEFEAL